MSAKIAITILIISCVLLGIASAQTQYRYPYQQTQTYNRPRYSTRNMENSGPLPPNFPPPGLPPLDGGALNPNCMPNQLASNVVDNKRPRH